MSPEPTRKREKVTSANSKKPGFRAKTRKKIRVLNVAYVQPRMDEALVSTACRLLPLVHLIEAIKPHVAHEPAFASRREKINGQMALVLAQLKTERPKRQALTHAFRTLGDFAVESAREVDKDDLRQSAKGFVVATLKNAPSLISAAHQAGLLS